MKIGSIFILCFFLTACSKKPGELSSSNQLVSRTSPTVTIATDLADITSANAAHFMLSGTCSENGQPITVVVGEGEEGLSPETAPTCTGGAWMAEIDLTHLTGPSREVSLTADHSIDNLNATQATGSAFLHPRVSLAARFLGDITADNLTNFTVSGTCSEEGQSVEVVVGGVSATPTCNNEAWVTEIDLSSLSGAMITVAIMADHTTSSGLSAPQATANVTLNPSISINTLTLENITAANAAHFVVSGGCSDNGQPVTVSVGTVRPETDPNCASGAWTITVDVTGLNKMAEISITVDHAPAMGAAYPQATISVINNFTCPTNYVGVPKLSGYTTNSFCVMKYEAKSDSGDAVSQASSFPYVSLNRNAAINKCTAIGEGYDLITNDEWQSIARNIELVPDNWATGNVGNAGGLSRGHSDNSPRSPLTASSDDTKGCFVTGSTCDNTTWDSQRRTLTLSNGEVVWDMAGNVPEWVKDDNDSMYGPNVYSSQVTVDSHSTSNSLSNGTTETSRNAKAQFGPNGDYTSLNTSPYGGLGYVYLNSNMGGVFRGGGWADGTITSVFAVDLNLPSTFADTFLGFRCVYHP